MSRAGAVTSVTVEGRVQVATADGVIACVKAGLGIAVVSRWMCRAELDRGEVQRILRDYELDELKEAAKTQLADEFAGREEIRTGIKRLKEDLWDFLVQTTHPGVIQLDGDTASGRAYVLSFGR